MAEIKIQKLHKRFGEFVAVRESSFTVGAGEYYLVMTSDIEDGGRWREVLNTTEGTFGVGGYGQASFEKNDGFSIIEQDFSESTGR